MVCNTDTTLWNIAWWYMASFDRPSSTKFSTSCLCNITQLAVQYSESSAYNADDTSRISAPEETCIKIASKT